MIESDSVRTPQVYASTSSTHPAKTGPEGATRPRGPGARSPSREGIDRSIYLLGRFEVGVSRTLDAAVRPGMTVVDIGANVGAHTLPLARSVGADGLVVALEPTAWAHRRIGLHAEQLFVARRAAREAAIDGETIDALEQETSRMGRWRDGMNGRASGVRRFPVDLTE